MTFKWPHISVTAWSYSHMVGYAGSPTRTVYVDMTLARSKVKVNLTGLLNFRQLAKPCMLAAMTAAPLRGFLVTFYFQLHSWVGNGRLRLVGLEFRITVDVSFSVSYSCSYISNCRIKYPVYAGCCRNWSSVPCQLVPETGTSFWYQLAGTRNWYQKPVNVS